MTDMLRSALNQKRILNQQQPFHSSFAPCDIGCIMLSGGSEFIQIQPVARVRTANISPRFSLFLLFCVMLDPA